MLSYGQFRFVKADREDLRERIFRLRYQVYVEEFCLENPDDHPGGRETDDYEPHSVHFAALNHEDEVVGTIRLVLHSGKGFPIEHVVPIDFPGGKPAFEKAAEISRLAVTRGYRRRREDGLYGLESYLRRSEGGVIPDWDPVPEDHKKRKMPLIVLGLYQAMYHESKRLGLTHWYWITDKKVLNTFKRFGFTFHPLGGPVNYHGVRTPYVGVISDMENKVMRENPFLMKLILRGLEDKHLPHFSRRSSLKVDPTLLH